MKTQDGSDDTASGLQAKNGRTIGISAAIFAACLAMYLAEENGFRIFDENVSSISSLECIIPSPLETLAVLGITSLGVCAGLVSLIAIITWIVRFMRGVRQTYQPASGDCAGSTARCAVPGSNS